MRGPGAAARPGNPHHAVPAQLERCGEPLAVGGHGRRIVTDMVAEIEGVERRRRDAAGAGGRHATDTEGHSPSIRKLSVAHEGRHVDVVIGTQPSGQGHETSFAQVVSDLLWVPPEKVRIILGDTDIVHVGFEAALGNLKAVPQDRYDEAAVLFG